VTTEKEVQFYLRCLRAAPPQQHHPDEEHMKAKPSTRSDTAQDRAIVTRGVHQHEANLHKGKPKTKLKLGGKKGK
jgi:hypothetical protein